MKFSKYAFYRTVWVFGLLFYLTPTVLLAVDEASLPVIPDTPGASFDPAQVDTVSNKTRAFGGGASTKRLPPAPRTKAEIIRLMKKPNKTRGIGGKALSPKARAYINFSSGSARIQPASYSLLNEWAAALQSGELASATVKIAGHTDNVGSEDMNMDLSTQRASSVKTYLVEQGITEDRFQLVPYGEGRPYASNSTEAGRALNRRVEFILNYSATEAGSDPAAGGEEPYYE